MSIPITYPLVAAALTAAAGTRADGIETRPLPAVPDKCGFAGAFAGTHGNHLLAGGGANFPDGVMPWNGGKKVWHDSLFALDLSSPGAQWKVAGRLPKANGYGVSLTTREGIILIGGGDAAGHFSDVWLLTRREDGTPEFRALPPLPSGLAQMAGALVGRRIHLCGGIGTPDATEASNAHWTLDLDAPDQGWKNLAALPAPGRILATAAAVDGAFFIMAGCSLAADPAGKPVRTYLQDAWKYSAGTWTRIADLPRPSVASASPAPVRGQAFFVVSGDDGSQTGLASPADHKGFTKDVLRYDIPNNTWKSAGELSAAPPVTVAITPWKSGFIFFNGEIKPGVRTPAVFHFTPPADD